MNRLGLPLVFLLVALGGWLIWPDRTPAPEVRFNLIDAAPVSTSEFRGRPLLVNFWSVNCAICLQDMPELARLRQHAVDHRLEVIGVAIPQDPPDAVLAMVEKMQPDYPIALDVHGDVAAAFGGIEGTPTSFLINPQGKIALQTTGPLEGLRIMATLSTFHTGE